MESGKSNKAAVIFISAIIIIFSLNSCVIMLFFAPSLAMESVGKSIYASLFYNGDEEAVDNGEMEEYWYDPSHMKENIDAFIESMSEINDGMLYITRDNFEMILDKVIAYRGSVRELDNVYRYYQHHYKVVITYEGPKQVGTSGGSGTEDNSGSTDSGENGSSDGETTAAVYVPGEGLTACSTSSVKDMVKGSVFDISLKLPMPIRWLCSLFAPTTVYADEITLSIVSEGEAGGSDTGETAKSDGFLMWPLPQDYKTITSKYGPRNAPVEGASTFHRGIDIACPEGTQVYAAEKGTVITADDGWHGGGGTTIFIDHGNGYYTCYMHLSELRVSVGDVVQKGQVIALSGNTGRSSGPHLHFGVYQGGSASNFAVNPSLYFDGTFGLTGPNEDMPDDGRYDSPAYRNDTPISIAPAPEPEVVDISDGDPYEVDGIIYEDVTTYEITDYEDRMQIGHIHNISLESETLFAVSWQEILTAASMKSITANAENRNWKTETQLKGSMPGKNDLKKETESETEEAEKEAVQEEMAEEIHIDAISRLDEATINQLIESFAFAIGYYFDPTSGEEMPGTGDTYAEHIYTHDEMENYAYIYSEVGENVEHGDEEFPPGTEDFDYYEYKKPAIAPAIAKNAYMTVEYLYDERDDGTAVLAGRQIVIDGQAFYDYMEDIIGEGFQLEWYCEFIKHLPGAKYNNMREVVGSSIGSLADRFDMVLQSYKTGKPYSYFDTDFVGVGEVILGRNCNRDVPIYTPRRDANGDLIVGGGGGEQVDLNITIDDITDEQIQEDIRNGLYSLEDLVYVASCIQAEAGSVDGQVAVAWCLRNRLPNYGSYKAAVSAPGQFASPWARYLDGSYSAQAQNVAAGVLRGAIANPIGECYYFFSASSVWGYKPGTYHINVGGNMFYIKWGDVTQIVGRKGYVPF